MPLYPGQGAPSATTLASTGGGNKYGSAAKAEVRAGAVNNATAAARIAICLTISSVGAAKESARGRSRLTVRGSSSPIASRLGPAWRDHRCAIALRRVARTTLGSRLL